MNDNEFYKVNVAGVERQLRLMEVAPGVKIAVLNILGDTELVQAAARALAARLPSSVLWVPHHGSRTSSTLAFVEAVSPQLAVLSLGAYNRYRFPAPEVLQRYANQGSLTLRTDLVGTVLVKSDGHSYQVRTVLPLAQ